MPRAVGCRFFMFSVLVFQFSSLSVYVCGYNRAGYCWPLSFSPVIIVFGKHERQESQLQSGRIEGYPFTGLPPFPFGQGSMGWRRCSAVLQGCSHFYLCTQRGHTHRLIFGMLTKTTYGEKHFHTQTVTHSITYIKTYFFRS